jgi:hypothetical protein
MKYKLDIIKALTDRGIDEKVAREIVEKLGFTHLELNVIID